MVYGTYSELVFMGFIKQSFHHWGAPHCTIWLFNIANWKIHRKWKLYWENNLFLWAIFQFAMLNNQMVYSKWGLAIQHVSVRFIGIAPCGSGQPTIYPKDP